MKLSYQGSFSQLLVILKLVDFNMCSFQYVFFSNAMASIKINIIILNYFQFLELILVVRYCLIA